MSDDWDTSGDTGGEVDPYNKSGFGIAVENSTTKVVETQVEKEIENLTVDDSSANVEVDDATPPHVPVEVNDTVVSPPVQVNQISEPSKEAEQEDDGPVRKNSVPEDAPDFIKESLSHSSHGEAFTEKLTPEGLKFFNELCEKPFSEQAQSFLNAYWIEAGSQAEFIFTVGWDMIKYADMHAKGVQYVHLYQEGNDLDFNIGLYFYEKLCKKVLDSEEGKKWRDDPQFKPSMPTMMTAIKRKIELREKVDINFDGRVSFLEYLLYQYETLGINPANFVTRAMEAEKTEMHPEIVAALKALEAVNKSIQAFESEKHRLEELAAKPGVKGLGAKHSLSILHASPLAEQLNKDLITAEAKVRIVSRKFGNGKVPTGADDKSGAGVVSVAKPTDGSVWWMNRDLEEKKKRYGPRKKN